MELVRAAVPALQAWLTDVPHVGDGGMSFVRDFVARMSDLGAAPWRCSLCLMTMHPEVFWRNLQWVEGEDLKVLERRHEVLDTPFFTTSPIAALRRGSPPIRVRLVEGELAYPICHDLRDAGGTDYYAQGLRFANGEISYVSWATRRPGGFSDETLGALDELLPWLARRVELESAYHGTRALLEVYLGANAARRVLAGAFRRGGGEPIEAAIWFCDLRDFTSMSDRLPAEQVVRLLDAYFDCVAGAIAEHGGEVLKFIGDAILAIFPVGVDAPQACRSALAAADEALSAISKLSETHGEVGVGRLSIGIALHLGSVMYGNIGARQRLDFTVISSAVNEACRLEALCKVLGTPLTMSEVFARTSNEESVVDLGERSLKGVRTPIRVFTLERHRPAG